MNNVRTISLKLKLAEISRLNDRRGVASTMVVRVRAPPCCWFWFGMLAAWLSYGLFTKAF